MQRFITFVLLALIPLGFALAYFVPRLVEKPEAAEAPGERELGQREAVVVRLALLAPRKADVLIDGASVGPLEVAEDGRVTGKALVMVPVRAARLATRRVVLAPDPGLDPAVAAAAQRLFLQSGVADTALPGGP